MQNLYAELKRKPSSEKMIHIYDLYDLNKIMTKRLVRDGLSTMPLLLKYIPPAKIQKIL